MRYMRNNSGFTLVEVLVISPIVILFIGMFIALLVTLTGESLIVRERNVAVHDTQAALDDIQADISQATNFLSTTGPLQTPQGKNDANAAFTNTNVDGGGNPLPDSLIIKKAATTKNPADPSRKLIYLGAGDCDAKNPPLTYTVIYFVDLDTDTANETDKALYKRTILPSASACATPWQRGTCKRDQLSTYPTLCQTYDERLVGGIETLTVSYFANGTSLTGPTGANDASITIGVSKQVAGSSINYSSSIRTASPNIEALSSQSSGTSGSTNGDGSSGSGGNPPANAPIQFSRTNAAPYPYRTTITWSRVGNAPNGYTAKYRIAGGTEQSATIAQPAEGTAPSLAIDATARKQSVQLTELKVLTTTGTVDYGSLPTIPNIPSWNECAMPNNGWRNYGSVYNDMGYTKTTTGIVGLKGLITDGAIGSTVCTLPVGFRPTEHIIVQQPATTGSSDRAARVDIFPDGRITIPITPYGSSGTSNWVSLDGLMFVTSSANPTWTNNSYNSSWYFYDYNDGYGRLKSWKDGLGRTWVQGIATGGSQNAAMSYLPTAHAPDGGMHYPMYSNSAPNAVNFMAAGDNRMLSRVSGSYLGTNAVFYASTGGKYALPLYNGWTNYNYGWTTAQCYKGSDDIVILQGLVNNGNPAAGGLTNISGCAGGGSAAMSTGKNAILGGVAYSGGAGVDNAYRIDLVTDNYMYPYGGGASSGWTSLDGLHYIAN